MALLLFGLSFPMMLSAAEAPDATCAGFVGTWELRSVEMHAADGSVSAVWGEDPVGRLVYDNQGRMFALLMPSARNQAVGQPIPEELQREVAGYYGSYVLDTDRRVVTHRVAVSLRTAESGQVERAFVLQGDALTLTAHATRDGRPVTYVLTWLRLAR